MRVASVCDLLIHRRNHFCSQSSSPPGSERSCVPLGARKCALARAPERAGGWLGVTPRLEGMITCARTRRSAHGASACAVALIILISVVGLSFAPVGTAPMRLTASMPALTLPKMVCFPSSHGVGASVMKNCEPAGSPDRCVARVRACAVRVSVAPARGAESSGRPAEAEAVRTVAVFAAVCHREHAGTDVLELWIDLILEFAPVHALTAPACACRVAALRGRPWVRVCAREKGQHEGGRARAPRSTPLIAEPAPPRTCAMKSLMIRWNMVPS